MSGRARVTPRARGPVPAVDTRVALALLDTRVGVAVAELPARDAAAALGGHVARGAELAVLPRGVVVTRVALARPPHTRGVAVTPAVLGTRGPGPAQLAGARVVQLRGAVAPAEIRNKLLHNCTLEYQIQPTCQRRAGRMSWYRCGRPPCTPVCRCRCRSAACWRSPPWRCTRPAPASTRPRPGRRSSSSWRGRGTPAQVCSPCMVVSYLKYNPTLTDLSPHQPHPSSC